MRAALSPDLNPIEETFAKLKNLLRKAAGRSKGALVEAIAAALYAITVADARGFFGHAGYCTLGQLTRCAGFSLARVHGLAYNEGDQTARRRQDSWTWTPSL